MKSIPIDTAIGQNVAELRIGSGTKNRPEYTQERLARYLRLVTTAPWDQSQISLAERGKRRFAVADLLALGFIFDVAAVRLMHTATDVSISLGRIGIPEADLLERWLLGGRPQVEVNTDQLEAVWATLDPEVARSLKEVLSNEPKKFDQDTLQTTWRERNPRAIWAIEQLLNALDSAIGDVNGDH